MDHRQYNKFPLQRRTQELALGFFIAIDGPSYEYLFAKAIASHKTPVDIIGDMVQEQIAARISLPSPVRFLRRDLSISREKAYTDNMDLNIEFNQAAFTHHIEEADIRFAISTARYDARIDEDESDNKHLIIGFDQNVNLLEVMYNVIDEDTINVFHAMKCRKNFLPLIKARGESNG